MADPYFTDAYLAGFIIGLVLTVAWGLYVVYAVVSITSGVRQMTRSLEHANGTLERIEEVLIEGLFPEDQERGRS